MNHQTLLTLIDAAIHRISEGNGLMRIPADPTDPDMVLGACRTLLREQQAQKPVAKVRHFLYFGIARNGHAQEAQMLDSAPELSDGTLLYSAQGATQQVHAAWQTLDTCTAELIGPTHKALIWARFKLMPFDHHLAFEPYWTEWTTFKGLWMQHRGEPKYQTSWDLSYHPRDGSVIAVEVSHWMPDPLPPINKPTTN